MEVEEAIVVAGYEALFPSPSLSFALYPIHHKNLVQIFLDAEAKNQESQMEDVVEAVVEEALSCTFEAQEDTFQMGHPYHPNILEVEDERKDL